MTFRFRKNLTKTIIFFTTLLCFASLSQAASVCDGAVDKEDTWLFDPGSMEIGLGGGGMAGLSALGGIGISVGGAKDINNFRAQIEENYLPQVDDLTYEGLFYNYYFDLSLQPGCEGQLLCPNFYSLRSNNPMSMEDESYLTVRLVSGLNPKDIKRKPLNLTIVVDISGSMGSSFNKFYYDQFGNAHELKPEDLDKTKMEIANRAILKLTKRLRKDDRFAVVLFDNASYLAKPFNHVCKTDMEALSQHILDLKPQGGTNFEAGFKEARELYDDLSLSELNSVNYENRIIFLTDAMPNTGDVSDQSLLGMIEKSAKNSIYTSFIGIGLDFNNELVEKITKVEGANYYSVHDEESFAKQMDEDFDNMVNPIAFDVSFKVENSDAKIEKIYGTPDVDLSDDNLIHIRTLFPAPTDDKGSKGGVIVLKMKDSLSFSPVVNFSVNYKTREGVTRKTQFTTNMNENDSFNKASIRKAVMLARYGNLLKDWVTYERSLYVEDLPPYELQYGSVDSVLPILPPYIPLGEWEQKSVPLNVSSDYHPAFSKMLNHMKTEMKWIKDKNLEQELDILEKLTNL